MPRPANGSDEDAQRIEDRKENLMEAINRLSDVKSARARLTAMRQAISERIDACQGEGEQLAAATGVARSGDGG